MQFLTQRLFQSLLVMFVISLLAFAVRSQLGDPTRELAGQGLSAEERATLREEMGLNTAWPNQYGHFLAQAVQGDFGPSLFYKKPALSIIAIRFSATFELALLSLVMVLATAIPLGIRSALHPQRYSTKMLMQFSLCGLSIPVFLLAILLIYVFAVEAQWLPSYGRGEVATISGWTSGLWTRDGRHHLILPVLTLFLIQFPIFLRLVTNAVQETLPQDYIRTAWAKGVTARAVHYKHALRNALPPIAAMTGVQMGSLMAFTIITETIFQWPGMGALFLEAIQRSDLPLITAYLMVVGLIFVTSNTLADLAVLALNPQARERS